MSFYRSMIVAVAAMGLATCVFAADENTTTNTTPAQQTTDATTQTTGDAAAAQEKVNLNKATAKELAKVKGLNAAKAKAIVAYRKKHGEFKSTDDLKEVKGFKHMDEKTMKDIQDQLTAG